MAPPYGNFDGLTLLADLAGPAEIANDAPVPQDPDAPAGNPLFVEVGMGNRFALLIHNAIDSGVEVTRLGLVPVWYPHQNRLDGYLDTPYPNAPNVWYHQSEVTYDPGVDAEEQFNTVVYAPIRFPVAATHPEGIAGRTAAKFMYTGVGQLDYVGFFLALQLESGGVIAADDALTIYMIRRGFAAQ